MKGKTQGKFLARSGGYSIIEMLVVLFILGLVAVAAWTFQSDTISINRIFQSELWAQQDAQMALKSMSAEIRSASQSSVGAYAISQASSTSFIFYSDIDDDGLKERVRYYLEGAVFKKGVLKPSGSPLVYNPAGEILSDLVFSVSNGTTSVFEYYDSSYAGTSSPLVQPVDIPSVRLIKTTLIIAKNPRSGAPMMLTTQVSIRNLKDNL
jgi:prepilin-type N-terminal cleavage/methylation domain-containing protein